MKPTLQNNQLYKLTNLDRNQTWYFTSINQASLWLASTTPSVYNMLYMTSTKGVSNYKGEHYTCEIIDGPNIPWCKINPVKFLPDDVKRENAMLEINAERR